MAKKSGNMAQPEAPDPIITAEAQKNANIDALRESANINAVSQHTPYGSVTYQKDEYGVPVSQHTNLNPTSQKIFDTQQGIALDLSDLASSKIGEIPTSGFSLSGYNYDPSDYGNNIYQDYQKPNLNFDPSQYSDVNAYTDNVSQNFYDKEMSLLKPQMDIDYERAQQELASKGFGVGSEAYNAEMDRVQRLQDAHRERIANDAVLAGGVEASRILGMEQALNSSAFGQHMAGHQQSVSDDSNELQAQQGLRSSSINEDLMARNQGLNEMAAMLGAAPAFGVPQAEGVPKYSLPAVDHAGLVNSHYQAQQNSYNNQVQQSNNRVNQAIALAGTMAAFSNSRLKNLFGPGSVSLNKLKELEIHDWEYNDQAIETLNVDSDRHVGPTAEDWRNFTGLGDGITINLLDGLGVMLSLVQQLSHKVEELERQAK